MVSACPMEDEEMNCYQITASANELNRIIPQLELIDPHLWIDTRKQLLYTCATYAQIRAAKNQALTITYHKSH